VKNTCLLVLFLTGTAWAQSPYHSEEVVMIGGIKQYIAINGRDKSLPILLFLHGGPGNSVLGYAEKFTRKLQEHFLVVQWDQRQTGKTLEKNASPLPFSVETFENDTHELIRLLLQRYRREKIFLLAHSWGTVLGFTIAAKYPELLYAYIPVGAMINQLESERIALGMMKEKARKTNNAKEIAELSTVHIPFEDGNQLYFHRKWLADLNGSHKKISRSFVVSWSATWLSVFNEASKRNLMETLPNIGCPVYFFAGRKDYQTNSTIAEAYFTRLVAPAKGFFWFENSGHAIPSSEPEQMQDTIIEKILPETLRLSNK
jgi:pimeloyl-ACP methyl ester carboxylesterase